MKKFLLIITIVCYTIASYGVSLNYMYCCGKLQSVSIKKNENKCCKKKCKKSCCKNEKIKVKLKLDQKDNHQKNIDFAFETLSLAKHQIFNYPEKPSSKTINFISFQIPPPLLKKNLNIIYCTYRI